MSDREYLGKEELGRELGAATKNIEAMLRSFDRNELLPFCLSVLSGITDAGSEMQRIWSAVPEQPALSMLFAHLREWRAPTEIMLAYGWSTLPASESYFGEPPPIRIMVFLAPEDLLDQLLERELQEGRFDPARDKVAVTPFSIEHRVGYLALIVVGSVGHRYEMTVPKWLDARQRIADSHRVFSALTRDARIWRDERGLHHPEGSALWGDNPKKSAYDYTDGELEELGRILSRRAHVIMGDSLPHRWATNLPNVGERTIQEARMGRGSLNRMLLKKEASILHDDFMSLPGFARTFLDEMHVGLDEFLEVMKELEMVPYPFASSVFVGAPSDVVKKVSKKTQLSRNRVVEVLDVLENRARRSLFRPVFRLSRDLWLTSFDWVASYELSALDSCFYGPYDVNFRGRIFEQRCRDRLTKEGYSVLQGALPVVFPEKFIESFQARFGFEKKSTDIDVLAHKSGVLLFLECKEIKPRFHGRGMKRLMSLLQNRRSQLDWIVRWASSDLTSLTAFVPRNVLKEVGIRFRGHLWLAPLFVMNLDVELDAGESPVIRIDQLDGIGGLPEVIEGLGDKKPAISIEIPGQVQRIPAYSLKV